MALTFYPHSEDVQKGTLEERTEILLEAAQRFKIIILEVPLFPNPPGEDRKRAVPRWQTAAYNWEEIARVLREIREVPEASKMDKLRKALLFTKLSEVYEVLRAAKMSKLEAVRLALINEANQLRGGAAQGV